MHQSGEEAMLHQDCQRCHNCRLAKDRTGEEYDLKMSFLLCCRAAKDRTGKEYVFKCCLFSAVALSKIKM
jgi:hypothetical protein